MTVYYTYYKNPEIGCYDVIGFYSTFENAREGVKRYKEKYGEDNVDDAYICVVDTTVDDDYFFGGKRK